MSDLQRWYRVMGGEYDAREYVNCVRARDPFHAVNQLSGFVTAERGEAFAETLRAHMCLVCEEGVPGEHRTA